MVQYGSDSIERDGFEPRYKALENRQAEGAQLDLLLELLNDDLLPNQIRVARVDSDGLWLVDRNGIELAWGEMSDGYRAMLALLADIVHHLIDAYGIDGLIARDADGQLAITRSGVVLIDDHGLLGWCFDGLGCHVTPFAEIQERHPAVWEVCRQGYRQL